MKKNKNILLVMPYGGVGGMERLSKYFYNIYLLQGYKVKVLKIIQLKNDIINFEGDEIALSKKDFYEMSKIERIFFYITASFKINKLIKKHDITHMISFGDMANIFCSLSFSKVFKVGSIHALKSIELQKDTVFNRFVRFSYKFNYRNFDKVVAISDAIKNDLIDNCNYKFIDKLEVIYNPHDIEEIRKLATEPITNQKEKKIFSSDVILFIGRLSLQKAPWHLIKSFSILLKKKPNSKLVFIGDGDEMKGYLLDLIDILKINNSTFFIGRKNNPFKYLSKSKVLALTSYYEGTPNVIVEAMALSTPIVTTNCTDGVGELMGEVIKNANHGVIQTNAGFITPTVYNGKLDFPDDFDYIKQEYVFAGCLLEIIENKVVEKSNILDEALKKFDISYVSNKYLE